MQSWYSLPFELLDASSLSCPLKAKQISQHIRTGVPEQSHNVTIHAAIFMHRKAQFNLGQICDTEFLGVAPGLEPDSALIRRNSPRLGSLGIWNGHNK